MSPRRNRIEKVVTLREKELDKKVAQLSEQRAAEQRAHTAEEQKKLEMEAASQWRLRLTEGEALSAMSWIEANEWLQSRQKRHEQARMDAARAQLETRKAQGEVMVARSDLKKVELLSERIQTQEQEEAHKAERRLEDELSALRFRRSESD
jgi:flagellar export protein FliJ